MDGPRGSHADHRPRGRFKYVRQQDPPDAVRRGDLFVYHSFLKHRTANRSTVCRYPSGSSIKLIPWPASLTV